MLTIEYKYVDDDEKLTFVNKESNSKIMPCLFKPESVIPNHHLYSPAGIQHHLNKYIAQCLIKAVEADVLIDHIVVSYNNNICMGFSTHWSITVLPEGFETCIGPRKSD